MESDEEFMKLMEKMEKYPAYAFPEPLPPERMETALEAWKILGMPPEEQEEALKQKNWTEETLYLMAAGTTKEEMDEIW
jgi:hypothetical protein